MQPLARPLVLLAGVAAIIHVRAQYITAEAMTGDKNYWYQHTFFARLADSRFGIYHVSSLHLLYNEKDKNEVMSQSYITYQLAPPIKVAVGTFYATNPGISPSLAMQLRVTHRHLRAMLVPRVDLKSGGSIEAMTLLEYLPPINEVITFYSRLQMMSNYGPRHHNRSYENMRIGLK